MACIASRRISSRACVRGCIVKMPTTIVLKASIGIQNGIMNSPLSFLKKTYTNVVNQKILPQDRYVVAQDSRHQLPFRIRRIRKSADVMPRTLVLAPPRPQHLHASGLWDQAEVFRHVLTCMIAYRSSKYQSPIFCLLQHCASIKICLLVVCEQRRERAS